MEKVTVRHQTSGDNGCLGLIGLGLVCGSLWYYGFVTTIFIVIPLSIVIYFYGWRIIFFVLGQLKKIVSFNNVSNDKEVLNINNTTTILNPFAGVFICGGAGSGKSKSLVEPIIKEAGKKGYTGVIYDFKFPELAEYAETAYRNTDIKPYYFNFEDLTKSNKVNPIAPEIMENESYAREFAYTILANINPQMISKPDFWSDNSVSFLSAIFWYLREKYPRYCTLPHAISLVLQPNTKQLLLKLMEVEKCSDMIAPILTAYENKAENQIAGVVSSLQVSLSKINIDEIYYLMSSNEVDLRLNEPNNKSVLVIGNNPQLSSTYAPIMGLILASVSKQLNRRDKEKSIFLLDEFPTIYVPNIEQLPATARSNKVATILACQDIAQLNDKYTPTKAETILSNLGNQFYGRTTNPTTAKRVSDIFGKETQTVVSKTRKTAIFSSDVSTTESTRESDRVKVQDVASLSTGCFFSILSQGREKQGISIIKIDKKFQKSKILPFSSASKYDIEQAYKRVKQECKTILG